MGEFTTTVQGLLALRDRLTAHTVTRVAMEATGVHRQAVWHVLEDDFELTLLRGRRPWFSPAWGLPGRAGRALWPAMIVVADKAYDHDYLPAMISGASSELGVKFIAAGRS